METLERNSTTAQEVIVLEDGNVNPLTGNAYSQRYRHILVSRRALPVSAERGNFLRNYQQNRAVILTSDTGSGKTTQIPQYVLVDEWNSELKVVCTQPRRLAAREVAARVTDELDVKLGDEVGYAIKGDNKNTAKARLVYITEGFLLQQAKRDRRLSELSCVIIDEAHERTVDTDMLLGLLAG